MATAKAPVPVGPRGWRRKWQRAPARCREAAAAALGDVLARRRRPRGALWVALLAAAGVHAAMAPLMTLGEPRDLLARARAEGYLRRVLQAERAKSVSRRLKDRISMPPAPPAPEAVVSETLGKELSSDIVKVVGNLLTADVTEDLTAHVRANLADELAQAAKNIADGNLSEADIRQLQEDMKRRAHKLAVEALKVHRIRTQVKRAQISVTRWYEEDVSVSLMKNIYYETFMLPHKGAVWHQAWTGKYFGQQGKVYNWSQVRSLRYLDQRIKRLRALAAGRAPFGPDRRTIATWPRPSAELAEAIDGYLRRLHGEDPSWRQLVHGGADRHKAGTTYRYTHRTDGLLKEFYPHRLEEMSPVAAAATRQWEKALAALAAYVAKARSGTSGPELKPAHDACVGAMLATAKAMEPLGRANQDACRTINAIVRADVLLGPRRERVYQLLVDKLVAGLSPLIKEFAIGQFEEGIIKWDRSAEEAMELFPEMIFPLLRRDVKRLFPKKRFDKLAFHADYPDRSYKSLVTGQRRDWPSDADVEADRKELARLLNQHPELQAYAARRREILAEHFEKAAGRVVEEILSRVLSEGLMFRDVSAFVEGVDFQDKVREKLDARKRAMDGRGQDLARLTKDGVPDTSAAQYALLWGGTRGHGATLQPFAAPARPALFEETPMQAALRASAPVFPPPPKPWGLRRQVPTESILPKFQPPTPRFEGIPFLAHFPTLDGRLGDLAAVRPLILRPDGDAQPILVYVAWNYQGYFLHYEVSQPADRFFYPVPSIRSIAAGRRPARVRKDTRWAYVGDFCRLLFDTLDARNAHRGETHTQEFVVLPRGTDTNPYHPGVERAIASQRDAVTKEYRGVKSSLKAFPTQPMPQYGPDGSGPYRVCDFRPDGYSVEIFIPRSLFSVPVFAPGWYVGFDVTVAHGRQTRRRLNGQHWVRGAADNPNQWGDLLLLGTDPRVTIQRAEPGYPVAGSLVPGRSYLLTVVDPDRNVYLTAEDSVLVSAEVRGGANDMEVFVLKETGPNTGVFRGFVDTQPGAGRRVHGVLEVMPGNEAGFGYVDTANASGKRNVIYELKLPVVAAMMEIARP